MTEFALHLLRMADLVETRRGGAAGFMLKSSDELSALGVRVKHCFRETLAPAWIPTRLRRLVVPLAVVYHVLRSPQGGRPDVVELHEPIAGAYCFLRRHCRLLGLPPAVLLSYGLEERAWSAVLERALHTGHRPSRKQRVSVRLTMSQTRYGLRNADQVLVPSTTDANYLTDVLCVPPGRVKRINTGVSDAFFRLEPHKGTQIDRVIFVGTWIDRKGYPELVDAWIALSARHPRLRLTLAGTGIDRDSVLNDFPAGLRDTVTVRSEVDEVELLTLLAAADLFVLPSWFEGMPLSLLEAAAAGLPCIATGICGTVDFIRPDRAEQDGGVLVPPHSSGALAEAIDGVVSDPDRAHRLGLRGRERAREFTWAHTAAQALVAYEAAWHANPGLCPRTANLAPDQ